MGQIVGSFQIVGKQLLLPNPKLGFREISTLRHTHIVFVVVRPKGASQQYSSNKSRARRLEGQKARNRPLDDAGTVPLNPVFHRGKLLPLKHDYSISLFGWNRVLVGRNLGFVWHSCFVPVPTPNGIGTVVVRSGFVGVFPLSGSLGA
jgi:hypothetical protein